MHTSLRSEHHELVSSQSDLRFNEAEVRNVLRALKMKHSSGFDKVSNRMIKLLPSHFHKVLTQAYNKLFESAHWSEQWKSARAICLNKCDSPAPTTNQLRPISLLPTLSKIYESLFLLRFNEWSTRINILPPQQSGARPHQSTTSRVNALLEQINQSQAYNSFTPVVYVDFQQAFDKMWQAGLILKLSRLSCPSAYLSWLVNYFTNRTLRIDYAGLTSSLIQVKRGAPQGSCLGPVMYVTAHHDLPQIFRNPDEVHAFADDIAILYTPSIFLKHKHQITEIEDRINLDMDNLLRYASQWCQPLNPMKTEVVVYHTSVQYPKLNIVYDKVKVTQVQCFKYLGVHLDGRLSFRRMIEAQLGKLRKAYAILKYIHRQFPMAARLKNKFFTTYMWPHLYSMASFYVLLSASAQERLAAFFRRNMRLIHGLFQCPTNDLHEVFKLPTLECRYRQCLRKRLKSIQRFEQAFIDNALQMKNLRNCLQDHYRGKRKLALMPTGRPNRRTVKLLESDSPSFLDRLLDFVSC